MEILQKENFLMKPILRVNPEAEISIHHFRELLDCTFLSEHLMLCKRIFYESEVRSS